MINPQEEQEGDSQDDLKVNEDDGRRIGSKSDSQMNREEKMSCDDQQENKHSEDEDREAKTQTGVSTNISTEATDRDQLQILGSCHWWRAGRT